MIIVIFASFQKISYFSSYFLFHQRYRHRLLKHYRSLFHFQLLKSSAVLITFLSSNILNLANFELYVRLSRLNFINFTILTRVKQLFVASLNNFFKLTNFLLKDFHAYLIKRQILLSLNQHALYHNIVMKFINIFDDEDLQNVVQHRLN